MRKVFQNLIRPMFVLVLTLLFSAAWAQNITVEIRDSDGNLLPDGGTATLDYWTGSAWVTLAPNNGTGDFTVAISSLPADVKMNYKLSSEQRTLTGSETSPVTFNTVTFTAIVQDGNGNTITGPLGYWSYKQTTFYLPQIDAGVTAEILPGTYDVDMTFHTSEQRKTGVQVALVNDPQTLVFDAVKVTPELQDCLGNVIDVANDPVWEFFHGHVGPCAFCDLNTGIWLLPGSEQAFWVKKNGVEIQRIGNYPPIPGDPNAYFLPNTNTTLIFNSDDLIVQIRDSESNILPNANEARLMYRNPGWVDIATNDGNGNFYVDPSFLGVEVMMVYNASQEKRILDANNISANCVMEFKTVTFTAIVQDANGNTLTSPLGYYNHRQNTWRGKVDAGVFEEILPGTHIIQMVFNTSKINRSGVQVTTDPHVEVFTTVTITPKLQDNLGNPMDVSSDPTWYLMHGWVGPAGCTMGSGVELLPGSGMGWKLRHNNVIVQEIGNYVPSSTANAPWFVPNVASDLIFTAPAPTPKTALAESVVGFKLYPNPVNRVATVDYTLEEEGMVDINVYSLAGELVANIYNGNQLAGQHILEWEVNGLTNGTYIVRAIVNNTVTHKRIVIAR